MGSNAIVILNFTDSHQYLSQHSDVVSLRVDVLRIDLLNLELFILKKTLTTGFTK